MSKDDPMTHPAPKPKHPLTDEQQAFQAATISAPPGTTIKLVATAGSGKTSCLVSTIEELVAIGTSPTSILATTFTSASAREIRKRLNPQCQAVTVGTFHSVALQALRRCPNQPAHAWSMDQCVNTSTIIPDSRKIWQSITQWNRDGVIGTHRQSLELSSFGTPEDYALEAGILRARGLNLYLDETTKHDPTDRDKKVMRKIVSLSDLGKMDEAILYYEQAKRALNAWDFDDALAALLVVIDGQGLGPADGESDSSALPYPLNLVTHIFVDEGQDNNKVQLALAVTLAKRNNAVLCLIGDQRQAIYGWRGASPDIFVSTEAIVHSLTYNFRSVPDIVSVGNNVALEMEESWRGEPARAFRQASNTPMAVRTLEAPDALAEAFAVAVEIKNAIEAGHGASDYAILVRTNASAALYEAALMTHKIPCARRGAKPFFGRRDVQGFIAYGVLHTTDHWAAFDMIVNVPKRYLSLAYKKKVAEAMDNERKPLDLLRAMSVGATTKELKPGSRTKAKEFVTQLGHLRTLEWKAACDLICGWCLEALPKREARGQDEDRRAVPEIICELAKRFESGVDFAVYAAACEENSLRQSEALKRENARGDAPQRVEISTIHSAKGLEYKHVYVSIARGLFPHANASTVERLAEERRLAYVAFTRAKDTLTVTWPTKDMKGEEAIGASIFARYLAIDGE